jgi:ParB-like chromosome segregation protein Spo0J
MSFEMSIDEIEIDHDLYLQEHKLDPKTGRLINLQFPDLLESIKQHGQKTPIIINAQNRLVAGFKRLVVLRQLGRELVKAVRQ